MNDGAEAIKAKVMLAEMLSQALTHVHNTHMYVVTTQGL